MAFLRNCWYVAAWSEELGDGLFARTILGEPLVLFRDRAGRPAALLDRCPHRLLPLSKGRLRGDAVECGYHGLTFDAQGACVRAPGQDRVPPKACVRAYPVAEHLGMVWVWPGDPERADTALLFDKLPQWALAQGATPAWGLNCGPYTHVRANYQLLTENLVDPAHVSFVHPSTLGTAAMVDIPVETTQVGDTLLVTRWTLDSPAAPILQRFGKWPGNVDRWQYYWLFPPSIAVVDFGSHTPGMAHSDAARDAGLRIHSCHFLTPESETSTHYFWFQLRNFAQTDPEVSREITEQFVIAFAEDKAVLEAIQEAEAAPFVQERVKLALDSGSVRLRRTVARMIAEEEAALSMPTTPARTADSTVAH
ncbi:MAG: aromatic ring-hydroxylating dioxygenase subunit alpha [Burkholderiales bacterium]|nr:aromatic ring-hydroxylating dioxygenase subunit alpha [Burkholderiales bacterium]